MTVKSFASHVVLVLQQMKYHTKLMKPYIASSFNPIFPSLFSS